MGHLAIPRDPPADREIVVRDRRHEIAQAVICQYPWAGDPERRHAHICMDFRLEGVEMEPEDIERLAITP